MFDQVGYLGFKCDGWSRWKIREMPENEEPCWLCGRAGFSKIGDLKSDRELPASLLGDGLITRFACELRIGRPRFDDLGIGAK